MKLYIGIDWSEKKHDIVYMNENGATLLVQQIEHTQEGFNELDKARIKFKVAPEDCVVGIETNYTLLIEYLWAKGYQRVYMLPPSAVKRSRGRFKQTNAQTDQSDAWLEMMIGRRRWR